MKKFIAGLLFILIAAVVMMPYINGVLAEQAFTRGIQEVNSMYADTGTDLSLEIVRYDRGFSSSTITWKIFLGSMSSLYGIEEIVITDRARHGFTGVTSQTDLRDNDWFAELVDTRLGGTTPFEITTNYTLAGKIQSTVIINPFTLQIDDEQFAVKPARFTASTDRHFKRFISEGSWGGFSIADVFLNFHGFSFNSDLTLISPLILDGNTDFTVDTISIKDAGTLVEVEGVTGTYHLVYNEKSNSLSTGVSYEIASVDTGLDTYKDLSVAIGLKKIDAAAYENALTVYMDLVNELVDDISTAQEDPEAVKEIVEEKLISAGLQMMAVYEQLLKEGLEISITNLHAKLPEGEIKGDAGVRLEQDLTLGQIAPVLHQPERVFDFLTFHSNISLPKELVGDPPALLSPIFPGMETGIFIEKDQYLVHKAETRDNKLYLNDVELHLN